MFLFEIEAFFVSHVLGYFSVYSENILLLCTIFLCNSYICQTILPSWPTNNAPYIQLHCLYILFQKKVNLWNVRTCTNACT